jgi:hypothetical protein
VSPEKYTSLSAALWAAAWIAVIIAVLAEFGLAYLFFGKVIL